MHFLLFFNLKLGDKYVCERGVEVCICCFFLDVLLCNKHVCVYVCFVYSCCESLDQFDYGASSGFSIRVHGFEPVCTDIKNKCLHIYT
jgi:hypothetical protein